MKVLPVYARCAGPDADDVTDTDGVLAGTGIDRVPVPLSVQPVMESALTKRFEVPIRTSPSLTARAGRTWPLLPMSSSPSRLTAVSVVMSATARVLTTALSADPTPSPIVRPPLGIDAV